MTNNLGLTEIPLARVSQLLITVKLFKQQETTQKQTVMTSTKQTLELWWRTVTLMVI